MKGLFFGIIFLLVIAMGYSHAFAQVDNSTDDFIDDIVDDMLGNSTSAINLFVPSKMIVGEEYEGLVTLLNPTFFDTIALLESKNDFLVKIEEGAQVSKNSNHGIFSITPLKEGQTEIYAIHEGELATAITTIYSKQSGPQKVKIILPGNSTIADDLKGFVFLLDGNNAPVLSDKDRIISLIPSEKITTPRQVTILNGTTHASFDFTVHASGSITGTAINLYPDTVEIEKAQTSIDVMLGIAPDISLENSYAHYFVWLEKDGRPFSVPQTLKVELSTSDNDVARLSVTPPQYSNDNTMMVSMYDGIATGKVYTGQEGMAEITASIPNYGHASADMFVGFASMTEEIIVDQDESEFDIRAGLEANNIRFWIFPDVTDDIAYGVAALYHSVQSQELDIDLGENDTQITEMIEFESLIPMPTDNSLFSISSQAGLKYDSSYIFDSQGITTHTKIFPIEALSSGEYTVTATGGKSFDEAELEVTTTSNSQYSISISQLPTLAENTQPLLLVSIVDEENNIIDVSEIFGNSLVLHVNTVDSIVDSSKLVLNENNGVVSGILNGVSTITITSERLGGVIQEIYPSGVPINVELERPETVHAGETFPYVIHDVDAQGIPISKKNLDEISTSGFDIIGEGLGIIPVQGEQKVSILADIGGAVQEVISTFVNSLFFTIEADASTGRIGQDITITVLSQIEGATYSIDSPFPHRQIDETTFIITPDTEILNAEIQITADLDGFNSVTETLLFSSENVVEITAEAQTPDGKILSPGYKIESGNFTTSSNTPHIHSLAPQQTFITFDSDFSTTTGGYKLIDMEINGESTTGNIADFYPTKDTVVRAIYDKFVNVIVIDAEGTGIYPVGTQVLIEAEDKAIIPFLIVDKFDYWIGSNEGSVFLYEANKDITVTAIYKQDFAGLMIVVFVGIIAAVILIFKKGDSTVKYHIEDIIEKITSKLNIKVPKIPKIKK